ncbi:hypothetical protein LTS18_013895, partial [Coniosporium uncinatum]
MLEHCTVPLRDIKRTCGLRPGQALFDTLLIWQETLQSRNAGSSPICLVDQSDQLEVKLTLEIEPREDGLGVLARYHTSVLPDSQVEVLVNQMEQLVQCFVEQEDRALESVDESLFPASLSIANPDPEHHVFDRGLSGLVESVAESDPAKIAITFGSNFDGQRLHSSYITYNQLNRHANQVAHHVLTHNIADQELICVCMEKSIDLYVTILAIIKLGKGYLPITPETPTERTRLIIEDANVSLILSRSSVSAALRTFGRHSVLDVDQIGLQDDKFHNPDVPYS